MNPLAAVRRLLRDELARGASVNLLFTIGAGALAILSAIVGARYVGPAGVGVLSIGFLLVEFASVVDNIPTPGFIRDYSHKPTPQKVATVLVLKGALGLAVSALLLLIAPFVAREFEVPISVPLVFALIPAASILSSVAIMSYEARRDMVRRNAPSSVEALTRLLLYALVAIAPFSPVHGVLAIALATLGATLVGTLAGLYLMPRMRVREWDAPLAQQYASFGARTSLSSALQKIIFWFDIMLIDRFLGHETQGLYRTAYTLMAYLPLLAGAVTIQLYPQVANAFQEGRRDDMRRTLSLGFVYSVLIALPIVIVFLLFPGLLLSLLFGPSFADAAWMLRGLAAIGIVAVAFAPFDAFLPAANRPDLALKVSIAMVVLNTALDVVLIPRIGVAGAIAATAVTFVVGLGLAGYYLVQLGIPLPHVRDFFRLITRDG